MNLKGAMQLQVCTILLLHLSFTCVQICGSPSSAHGMTRCSTTDPIRSDEVWTLYVAQNGFITSPEVLNGLHVLKGKLSHTEYYTPPANLVIGRVSFNALDVKTRIFEETNDSVAVTSFDYVIGVVNHLLDETRKNIGVHFVYNENLSTVDLRTGRKPGLY
ncbi:hypothetical protein GGU11DRAFT_302054 [Lentinula aff. detonsa]|nr:hypothetical protein GGU11DRAFT_302054 [Lentinula aff. detonsa]